MGDIADMMIDGMLDHETGEYLGEPCGYPRTARQMVDAEMTRKTKHVVKMCKCGRLSIHKNQRKKDCKLCRKERHEEFEKKRLKKDD